MMKDREGQEEKDPFHLHSHPVDRGDDDGIAVRAYEADLHDRKTNVRAPITWRGEDAQGRALSIDTDEYDVLHLLRTLPNGGTLIGRESSTCASPISIDGMSDLASDVEDAFFMDADEVLLYYAQKRQRELTQMQRECVEAKEQIEREESTSKDDDDDDCSSDVITQAQLDLMRRTAHALRHASNPSTLEMRILANHGGDRRFAFLRRSASVRVSARITRVWEMLRSGKDVTVAEANGDEDNVSAKGLIAYESSDEEEDNIEEIQRKRRVERAREWSRKRQARLRGEQEEQ